MLRDAGWGEKEIKGLAPEAQPPASEHFARENRRSGRARITEIIDETVPAVLFHKEMAHEGRHTKDFHRNCVRLCETTELLEEEERPRRLQTQGGAYAQQSGIRTSRAGDISTGTWKLTS